MTAEEAIPFPTPADRLAKIASEIQQELNTASRNALESAILIGERLIEAKKLAGHGNFIPWIEQNFHAGIAQAQKYMNAAKHADTLRAKANSELAFALDMIPTLLALPDDPEDAAEIVAEAKTTAATDGKEPTQKDLKEAVRKAVSKTTRAPSKKVQKALDAYDRLNEAGEKPTKKAVQAEAGVGKSTVADAFIIREVAEPKPAAPLPELSMTAQQKLEAWQRKLEADFEYRVRQASKQWLDEVRITIYEEKIEKLMRMLSYPQHAVMRKVEYNKILKCLHPDHIANRTVEELGETFRIFTHYKLKMINDEEERADEMRKLRGNLPTREEMLARMKKPK